MLWTPRLTNYLTHYISANRERWRGEYRNKIHFLFELQVSRRELGNQVGGAGEEGYMKLGGAEEERLKRRRT